MMRMIVGLLVIAVLVLPCGANGQVSAVWSTLSGNSGRRGLSSSPGPEVGCVKWRFATEAPVNTSIAVGANNQVHISCQDGKLYTIDPNGVLDWSYDAGSSILTSPTVGADGTVYVGTLDGNLHAIDEDGGSGWVYQTEGPLYSTPAISDDGKVFFGSYDGFLYAVDSDGNYLWEFQTSPTRRAGGAVVASASIGIDGTVYIGGYCDSVLYALNPQTGVVTWERDLKHEQPIGNGYTKEVSGRFFAAPVVAGDGTIYVSLLYDPNLYAIDPDDGHIIWSLDIMDADSGWFEPSYVAYQVNNGCWSEPVVAVDGTIYVSCDDPYIRAINPDGSVKWVRRVGSTGGFTMTAGQDGLLYAASDDQLLYVLDSSGEQIGRFKGEDWLSYPVVAGNGLLYVSSSQSGIAAISNSQCQPLEADLTRPGDINTDGRVDLGDIAIVAQYWAECTDRSGRWGNEEDQCEYWGADLILDGDVDRDWYVDFDDLIMLTDYWLSDISDSLNEGEGI